MLGYLDSWILKKVKRGGIFTILENKFRKFLGKLLGLSLMVLEKLSDL